MVFLIDNAQYNANVDAVAESIEPIANQPRSSLNSNLSGSN
jgi:hypothetical protein